MGVMRSRHFWFILCVFVVISIYHYIEQIGITGTATPSSHFGLYRHAFDRILFLLPIVYASFAFGLIGGLTTCLAALLVMLPRVIIVSPNPIDALLETGGIFVIGVLISLWQWTLSRERAKTRAALAELQSSHNILKHYVQFAISNEKRLTTLNAISTMLGGSLDFRGLIKKAVHMVSELMEVEVALIFFIDEETQELNLVAHEGVSDEFAQAVDRIKIGEGVYGKVAKMGQSVVVDDVSYDPKLASPEFQRMQIRSQLIVPLIAKESVSGIICVAMRRPRQFTPDEIDLLTAAGIQIANYIENSRLYEKQRLVAERLAASERNYRRLFENASDAIWVHDLEGNIIAANKASEGLTGYSVAELTHMNARDFLSAESLALASQIRSKLFRKEQLEQPYEQRLLKKDGTEAILMLSTSLITEDEKPTGYQHVARDVTKERWMQENLRQYVQHITRAQEEERKRIARDLHDDTAQALYALSRQVDNRIRNSTDLSPVDAEFLNDLGEQVRKILQGVRHFGRELRPSMLDDLGLPATLHWLVGDMYERCGIEAELKLIGTEQRLESSVELTLFRIVQEALRNVEKHAGASKVEIEMTFDKGRIVIVVSDNGKGFKLAGDLGELPREGRLGLVGMEERAHLLGGSMEIQSELGRGTRVTIEIPME